MKKHLLILTQNTAAKIGIASYLSSIFHQYLSIQAVKAANVTPEILAKADCVLFSSGDLWQTMAGLIPASAHQLVCMRTFNHTYLHRILQIPPGSAVCLVNNTEETALEVIRQLKEYGFSQYHFFPFYPGSPAIPEDIAYAVTPGELHLVPATIRTVIDIGNRVVDISTVNEIIACFHLPTSLADEVTRNYMNHIVQVLKLSNQQLIRALDLKQLNRVVFDNIQEGVCLVNHKGEIQLSNSVFQKLLGVPGKELTNCRFEKLLSDCGIPYDFPRQTDAVIRLPGQSPFRLWYQHFSIDRGPELYLLHTTVYEDPAPGSSVPAVAAPLHNFSHFITKNPRQLHMLDTARRVSLNDYPIIIQGESGTEKEMLAQSIHSNSSRHNGPFISFSFSSLTPAGIEAELLGTRNEEAGSRQGALDAASRGTLLINGLQHTDIRTQKLLLNILQNQYYTPLGAASPIPLNVRVIAATSLDLYSLVLEQRFLDDLFFLLNTVSLNTIPLRERREDIPILLDHFLQQAFQDSTILKEQILSESLLLFLTQYDWPGNTKEMSNLCTYFSCIYRREAIPLGDLPGYILNQIIGRKTRLDTAEKKVLSLIISNPRIGRSLLHAKLLEEEINLSEGKIRTILKQLADNGYIKIHRTRGGCEATELGNMMSHV